MFMSECIGWENGAVTAVSAVTRHHGGAIFCLCESWMHFPSKQQRIFESHLCDS